MKGLMELEKKGHIRSWLRPLTTASAITAVLALAASGAQAADFTVNSGGDDIVADSNTTLREAVTEATLAGGSNRIIFDPSVTGTIVLTNGEIALSGDLSIEGPGAKVLAVSGNNASRIFNVTSGTIAISGLTLTGGRVGGATGVNGVGTGAAGGAGGAAGGGAILNAGTLTLDAVALTSNTAVGGTGGNGTTGGSTFGNSGGTGGAGGAGNGGAVFNSGTLTVTNSTLNGNAATGGNGGTGGNGNSTNSGLGRPGGAGGTGGTGAGAAIYSNGTLNVTNSTISGNTANAGNGGSGGAAGGFLGSGGSTGNEGVRQGGGIYSSGTSTIDSATITLNSTSVATGQNNGSGIYRPSGTLSVNNSIVAGNTPNTNTENVNGGINGANSNNITSGNPQLAPLADNGGQTRTHALQPGSPAFNAGNTSLPTDQRGFTRPSGSAADIGAFEAQIPVLDLNGTDPDNDNAVTFTEDGGAVLLANAGATLTDADDANLTGATVTLSAIPNGTDESLAADTTGTAITASYDNATGVLTLSGTDTVANYLQVLKTVTYNNASQDPDTTARVATFAVSDAGTTANAITTITIVTVNDAPVFTKGGDQTVAEDSGPQTVAGWATGIDPIEAGQTVSFIVTNDNNALFSAQPEVNAAGDLTYTPAPNANGSATVTVKAKDDGGTADGGVDTSADQTFTITVTPVNDAPVATDKNYVINEDTPKSFALPVSDVDPDTLSYTIIDQPTHGQLTGTAPNLTYTPNPDYYGTDFFTFKANDGTVDSNVGRVSFQINPVNDVPVAQNQSVGTAEDTPLPVTLTANDPDTASLTFSIVTQPAHGTLSGSGANRLYTPNSNFNGTDTFTFKANDGVADSNVATVTVTVGGINDAPVAVNDTFQVDEDTPTALKVLANDSDPDGTNPSIARVSTTALAHGKVTINADGTLQYVPEADYTGPATFTYTITDGFLESTATVNITVNRVDPAPVAEDDSYTVDGPVLIVAAPGVLANDSDAEGQELKAYAAKLPEHGTVTLLNDGSFQYRPNLDYGGSDSFTYLVTDGTSTDTATVTLDVKKQPRLTLTVAPASFYENDGPVAAVATLTRNVNLDSALSVKLGSGDLSEATVPKELRFPAGVASITFPIAAVDDGVVDGPQNVDIKAIAAGYPAISTRVRVLDNGVVRVPLKLTVASPIFSEGDGAKATTAEVSIPEPAKVDYVITLKSSDTSAAHVPATVTIRAGLTKASFYIGAVNDSVVDGTQSAIITAKRRGFGTDSAELRVSDDDTAALSLTISSETLDETGTVEATVSHNLLTKPAYTVLLTSSDTGIAQVPGSVIIPAGQNSVTFTITGVDNGQADGSRPVTITASRPGFSDAADTVNVVDGGTPTAALKASKVGLSTATAKAASSTVVLTFDGGLDADALNAGNFAVTVGGNTVAVEAASYDAATSSVTLVLAEGSLSSGDKANVAWNNLLDQSGSALNGQANVTAK